MQRKSILPLVLTLAVVVVAVVVFASGGSAKNRSHLPAASAVTVRHTAVGQTLTDANGRTLYLFEGDKRNVSTLSAAGRAVWPPFVASGKVKAEGAVVAGKLGTTTRGFKQVTYNGHPLYYYVGDHGAGSVKGQNLTEFGALWHVLSSNGTANTTTATATASQPAPATTYNYGY